MAVRLSPVLPAAVKDSPWLVYALAMIVYVPISSNWLGFERAEAITFWQQRVHRQCDD
ncbi:hypothetical protein NDR96_08890 [Stenotrophomonas maltophilia]|nr:hypothetical protein NDR96_08890 [Stenotrophomonas maltophilia]